MNRKIVLHLICVLNAIIGIAILISGAVAFLMQDPLFERLTLCGTGGVLAFLFAGIALLTRPKNEEDRKFSYKEGLATVAFGWLAVSIVGAVPFITVTGMHWYDAFFETASGFSTTGASVIDSSLRLMDGSTLPNGVESLSYGILFWRSLTHWLGGMGIVVLTIAILPLLNIGGQVMYNAEATGLKSSESKLAPRIASSAKLLWIIYVIITTAEVIMLYLGGMNIFDSVCHSFGTIATGGFSTKQSSIAYYSSAYIDWVITFFMFLSGCNFALHLRCFTGKKLFYWKDEEFRFYCTIILTAIILISLSLIFAPSFSDPLANTSFFHQPALAIRAAAFQVLSILSSTGFATADYCAWPTITCMILFILMFIGGCGGSTAGGMKCIRAMILNKYSLSEIRRCYMPHLLPDIRLNGERQDAVAIQKTIGFFALFFGSYLVIVILVALVCPGPRMDFSTAASVSIASLSNIGPGFGNIGPTCSYAWMTPTTKVLLSYVMILGRLELFTLVVLFFPSFWKK